MGSETRDIFAISLVRFWLDRINKDGFEVKWLRAFIEEKGGERNP